MSSRCWTPPTKQVAKPPPKTRPHRSPSTHNYARTDNIDHPPLTTMHTDNMIQSISLAKCLVMAMPNSKNEICQTNLCAISFGGQQFKSFSHLDSVSYQFNLSQRKKCWLFLIIAKLNNRDIRGPDITLTFQQNKRGKIKSPPTSRSSKVCDSHQTH